MTVSAYIVSLILGEKMKVARQLGEKLFHIR